MTQKNSVADAGKNDLQLDENGNEKKGKYPKIVFLIILNEFCERFCFYGTRTVLYIFLTGFIKLQKDSATAIYHAFTVICYFTPICGAIIADGYIGLYKTIVSLSIFYCLGEVILTLTSMKPLGAPNMIGPAVGLIVIAIGTGGIKPCVSAFGGNQFRSNQKHYLASFFSVFYLSINIGSTIGTILTPIFRNDIKCFENDCYPLAFGVPTGFMLIAIILFVIGTPLYRRDNDKVIGSDNIITKSIGCMFTAFRNKFFGSFGKKANWLDYAEGSYQRDFIADVKSFCRVILVFLPLPVFWALYDQQGSRWTSQAQQLTGKIGSSFTLKPDQFQAVNPILIVLLVPVFDFVIYPLFAKLGLLKKQLQRMSVGLIFAVIAFLIAAVLEWQMQTRSGVLNPSDRLKLLNLSPCKLSISSNSGAAVFSLDESKYLNNYPQNLPDEYIKNIIQQNSTSFKLNGQCKNADGTTFTIPEQSLILNSEHLPKTVLLYWNSTGNNIQYQDFNYNINDQIIGSSEVKFSSLGLANITDLKATVFNSGIRYSNFELEDIQAINNSKSYYKEIDYADYSFKIEKDENNDLLTNKISTETCARYTIVLFPNALNSSSIDFAILTDIYANDLSILWQLIQIFVMATGEVMFSISGLSFAYSEAAPTMKSLLTASWFLTVAFGNLIVVIVAEARMVDNQIYEYIIFAGLLFVATLIFMVIAFFYKYVEDIPKAKDEKKSDYGTLTNEKNPNSFSNIELEDKVEHL